MASHVRQLQEVVFTPSRAESIGSSVGRAMLRFFGLEKTIASPPLMTMRIAGGDTDETEVQADGIVASDNVNGASDRRMPWLTTHMLGSAHADSIIAELEAQLSRTAGEDDRDEVPASDSDCEDVDGKGIDPDVEAHSMARGKSRKLQRPAHGRTRDKNGGHKHGLHSTISASRYIPGVASSKPTGMDASTGDVARRGFAIARHRQTIGASIELAFVEPEPIEDSPFAPQLAEIARRVQASKPCSPSQCIPSPRGKSRRGCRCPSSPPGKSSGIVGQGSLRSMLSLVQATDCSQGSLPPQQGPEALPPLWALGQELSARTNLKPSSSQRSRSSTHSGPGPDSDAEELAVRSSQLVGRIDRILMSCSDAMMASGQQTGAPCAVHQCPPLSLNVGRSAASVRVPVSRAMRRLFEDL